MPRPRATQRTPEPAEPATLPGVIIPPSKAAANERESYWLELIDNPAEFRKAIATEDFFPLLKDLPGALWGDRLTLYLYRLPDDDGLMVKNPEGTAKYIKPVLRAPVDEDWLASRNGGGKYKLYLKLDSKENLREHTFRIDGPPKMQAGQIVEMDGKPVAIGSATPPPAPPEPRTDIATVIQANAEANKQTMQMLTEGAKASIEIVRDQVAAASKPDPTNSMLEKILPALIDRLLTPPPVTDPIATLRTAKELFAPNPAPEPPEPKDPPITEAMQLVESFTGKSFADIIRGGKPAAPDQYGWVAPLANVAQQIVAQLPTIIRESRIARAQEFNRQVWLRTAAPGTPPPRELLESHAPAPTPASPANGTGTIPAQPTAPADAAADPMQLSQLIVQMVRHGFDNNPYDGAETAAAIVFNFGKQLESTGLVQLIADETQVKHLVEGNPILSPCATDARWAEFQAGFIDYMQDRFDIAPAEPDEGKSAEPQPAA